MWAFTLIAVGFILGLFAFAGWVFAAPVALLLLVVGGVLLLKRRRDDVGRVKDMRSRARAADADEVDVEFTDRDRETLYER